MPIDPDVPADETIITNASSPLVTAGLGYGQVIRDTYGKRNRTIILHTNAMNSALPVITIIDHVRLEVFTINKNNSTGWDLALVTAPHHMLFNPETNYLYVTVPATSSTTTPPAPAIFKISLEMDAGVTGDPATDDPKLNTCSTLEEKAENGVGNDKLWNCTVIRASTAITGDNSDNSFFNLLCIHNSQLYVFYEESQYHNGGLDTRPNIFGYFDKLNIFYPLWTYGRIPETPLSGSPPAWMSYPNCTTWPVSGIRPAPCSYYYLKSWHYDKAKGNLTMAFSMQYISYGWETYVLELHLDAILNHTIDRTDTYRYKGAIVIESHYTAADLPLPYSYKGLQADMTIDASTFGYGQVEVYWTRTNLTGLGQPFPGIHFETGVQGTSVLGAVSGAVSFNDGAFYIHLDPLDPYIRIVIANQDTETTVQSKQRFDFWIREYPVGTVRAINVLSKAPLKQAGDPNRPQTVVFDSSPAIMSYDLNLGDTLSTAPVALFRAGEFLYIAINNQAGEGLGVWVIEQNGDQIKRVDVSGLKLAYNAVKFFAPVGDTNQSFIVGSSQSPSTGQPHKLQYFNTNINDIDLSNTALNFTVSSNIFRGLAFGGGWIVATWYSEVVIYRPGTAVGDNPAPDGINEPAYNPQWVRAWWDGTNPDIIIEGDDPLQLDETGRTAGITGLSFTNSKGEASYDLNFAVGDINYMPWVDSVFNENPAAPGTYSGVLEDGTRLIMQRGVLGDNGEWIWIDECQVFIISEPARAQAGIARMTLDCKGVIGMFITRSIYEWIHRPEEQIYTNVTFITTNNLIYYYNVSGTRIVDWKTSPAPIVKVNGVVAYNYTLHTSAGEIEFYTAQTGNVITATFTSFVPGTNEAEDIIICILRHPNEVGGCGLDDTYFTDNILNETLTTTNHLTYSFSKNNIRNPDGYNKIYKNGIEITTGFTWNYRNGTVTFAVSPIGNLIQGSCTYFTIQKSGITLREIAFTPKEQRTAYDCINEVVRRVAPNYIFHESPDGKLICNYYTQKADGLEDLEIVDDDIILRSFADNPMYYSLATYIISFGQAPLSELPNLCLGKTVINEWPYAWHPGTNFQTVVDGDPATQITTGYGRWSGDGTTKLVQDAINATGITGLPMISIDLGASKAVETIIVARGSQVATEGDAGAVVIYSLWNSSNGSSWKKLVDPFTIPPGQNVQFKAGTNYDEHTTFRYLRVNCHSLGLYNWKGHTNSQLGISEVQCYESEILTGIAKLQDEDPAAAHFDQWGLLKKYGRHLVYIARGGSPDPALYTQDKVDLDAGFILDEMMRLLSQVEIEAPYLPGVRLYDTIKIRNGALQKTVTMFVESRTVSETGDSIKGTNLP